MDEALSAEAFAFDPTQRAEARTPAERLVQLACLDYGLWRPEHLVEARALLGAEPALAEAELASAAACGALDALARLLASDPRGTRAAANARCGPYPWPPLLYACASRLPAEQGRSTLEAARVLLAAGADPNAGFLWRGHVPPFTALTLAFGGGEDGTNQPPHPESLALARLLLEAGADPNDAQTLYDRHFERDDAHLLLLLEFGLGRESRGPWLARFGARIGTPRGLLAEELWTAARKDFRERARLLLAHGAPVDAPGRRDGRTPWASAMRCGNHELAELLVAHGAAREALAPADELAAAVLGARVDEARAVLARHPGLRESLGPAGRLELAERAVEARRSDALRTLAALGFELWLPNTRTPLHSAAWAGELEIVRLLLALGARADVREPAYDATPLGWAVHNHQPEAAELLAEHAGLVEALEWGRIARVRALLDADPELVHARDAEGDPLLVHLHDGLDELDALIALFAERGAELEARDRRGRTLAEALAERGEERAAAALRRWL